MSRKKRLWAEEPREGRGGDTLKVPFCNTQSFVVVSKPRLTSHLPPAGDLGTCHEKKPFTRRRLLPSVCASRCLSWSCAIFPCLPWKIRLDKATGDSLTSAKRFALPISDQWMLWKQSNILAQNESKREPCFPRKHVASSVFPLQHLNGATSRTFV